ncbi:MAG: vWA domain-containing protein, partial [Hyphomicrobium sp.]
MFALSHPMALLLLPLALLPLVVPVQAAQGYPSLAGISSDPVSRAVDLALRGLGSLVVAALALGLGGLHLTGQSIARVGEGAHIVLLLDRSSSMDDTFAGKAPATGESSKSAAARSLLREFVLKRPHDRFGVAAFSTMPMYVLPLTDHKEAVLAAVDAITQPGLAFTNVSRGLA